MVKEISYTLPWALVHLLLKNGNWLVARCRRSSEMDFLKCRLGHYLTVTKERYTEIQMEIFQEDAEEASCSNIFMHDGAPLQEWQWNGWEIAFQGD